MLEILEHGLTALGYLCCVAVPFVFYEASRPDTPTASSGCGCGAGCGCSITSDGVEVTSYNEGHATCPHGNSISF